MPRLHPVALALETKHVAVMQEAVEHRGGNHVVAEDLAPLSESFIARDDRRSAIGARTVCKVAGTSRLPPLCRTTRIQVRR